jgi:uroporphyrinogen-III synthase
VIDLRGRRVGILEARLAGEAAALVRRHGGVPVAAPALREEPFPAGPAVAAFLDELAAGRVGLVVWQTGAGVAALFREAEAQGRADELRNGLARIRMLSRGPKPAAALAARGLRPTHGVASPYTTADVLRALDGLEVAGQGVAVVHYGEPNEPLALGLRARGARLVELQVYLWRPPVDDRPLRALAADVVAARVDAVLFTSQVQVRHLWEAAPPPVRALLPAAFAGPVVAAAVGPTCAEALHAYGVRDVVTPENPKLGPLVAALSRRLQERPLRSPEAAEVRS